MRIIWLLYNLTRVVLLLFAFRKRNSLIEEGIIDQDAEPHKFLLNLKFHDLLMFLWEIVIELVMFVYILRKSKPKMTEKEY